MRVVSLLYHDVIPGDAYESSGFSGPIAARYKLNREQFQAHMEALAATMSNKPISVTDIPRSSTQYPPVILTFDDGGSSATYVADILERYGWLAHFFITTNYIGQTGFVSKEQLRALRSRGHMIGSHSCSHPERMSHMSSNQVVEEWCTSIKVLSDILGERTQVASVPSGYYSKVVAQSASSCGISALFTSEPVTKSRFVDGCTVLGRYTLWRSMAPEVSAALASGRLSPRVKQW